tara:strand:+ start:1805 stop:2797 length:993 start_codon:yes stop_codon:yes gene_type:complete
LLETNSALFFEINLFYEKNMSIIYSTVTENAGKKPSLTCIIRSLVDSKNRKFFNEKNLNIFYSMTKIIKNSNLNRFQSAKVLVRDAGLYAMQWFRTNKNLQIEKKGPQDWVSTADREVEKMIRKELEELFPEDGFLGEESKTRNLDAEGIWVVDPIDGTNCFLNGISSWCVSIAYVLRNKIEIGVIYSPCSDELFAAHRGNGATLNGQPMIPSKANGLNEGIVGLGYSPKSSIEATQKAFDYLLKNGGVYHEIGSCALMTAYVAAGRYIGIYEYKINSWDCLAGLCMVQETGGWTNDFLADDGLISGNPIIASSPKTREAMQKLFSAAGH